MKRNAFFVALAAIIGHNTAFSQASEMKQNTSSLVSPTQFGAVAGHSNITVPLLAAYATSAVPVVNIPFSVAGYTLNDAPGTPNALLDSKGHLLNWNLGVTFLNGNQFSGAGIGAPDIGAGAFNSTYTNPWNVTTNVKMEFDPASLPEAGIGVTNQALSIECRPNRPNIADGIKAHHWIACVYRGADTGVGGAPGTSINTEVDNDVLNLATNSGTVYEVDVNVNGNVADGGIQRGIFVTGGGVAGNVWNGVALDIQHGTYSGSGALNWSTGVSVRNATRAFSAYAESDGEGFLYEGFDKASHEVFHVDSNGYVQAKGIASDGNTITNGKTCFNKSCIRYIYEKNGKIVIGNKKNGDVASIDDNGNLTIKGHIMQNSTL